MATTYTGNDGNVTGPLGAKLSTFNFSVSRISHDITGFSNVGRERKLGLWDIRGSAGGLAQSDTSAPWAMQTNLTGQTITLYICHATTTSVCSIQFGCVIEDVAFAASKGGDNGVTFNFGLSSNETNKTATPFTQAWLSS